MANGLMLKSLLNTKDVMSYLLIDTNSEKANYLFLSKHSNINNCDVWYQRKNIIICDHESSVRKKTNYCELNDVKHVNNYILTITLYYEQNRHRRGIEAHFKCIKGKWKIQKIAYDHYN